MSAVIGSGQANTVKRVGYFDDNNGIFYQLNGTSLSVVRRTSVSGAAIDTTVSQASWNLDPLNGSGPSGITLDLTKAQVLVIDLQWLGVGRVRLGVDIDGEIIYCHEFLNANSLTSVYMSTPNLPLRYEIVNTGVTAATASLEAICMVAMNESGFNPRGPIFGVDNGIVAKSIATTLIPLVRIRLKSTSPRAGILPIQFSVLTAGNADFRYDLRLNPTITGGTGPAWTSANINSHVEFDVASTGTVSGGTTLLSDYASTNIRMSGNQISRGLQLLNSDLAGTTVDELVLSAQKITGASVSFYGAISWMEIV
jgi:hypothetical protein